MAPTTASEKTLQKVRAKPMQGENDFYRRDGRRAAHGGPKV